jgi:hypothetical protein
MRAFWRVLFIVCIVAPMAGFAQEKQDPVVGLNSCGYMGQTPIQDCTEVEDSKSCPRGWCEIGRVGGRKRCGHWASCSTASCIGEHGKNSVCVYKAGSGCAAFSYQRSLVDEANK